MLSEKIVRDFTHHAPFSPSSMSRTMKEDGCPIGTYLSFFLPDQKKTAFSTEGTLAHDVAENKLLERFKKDFDPSIYTAEGVDAHMLLHGDTYADYIQNLLAPYKGCPRLILTEEKIKASDDLWGTIDCLILVKLKDGSYVCIIIDYKYGKYVEVSADYNWQLIAYIYCVFKKYIKLNIKRFETHIVQPRAGLGIPSYMNYDTELLKSTYFPKIEESIGLIKGWLDSGYTPKTLPSDMYEQHQREGKHCMFCNAKDYCNVKNKQNVDTILGLFNNELKGLKKTSEAAIKKELKTGVLSIETMAYLAKNSTAIENLIKASKSIVIEAMANGTKISGYGLKKATLSRKWDPDKFFRIAEVLRNLGVAEPLRIKKDLITISAAEEIVGKDVLDKELFKEQGTSYKIVDEAEGEDINNVVDVFNTELQKL